jgi:N-acetylglucosamine kinase-like BadF-type ATPase
MLFRAKVKGTVAAFCKPSFFALELHEKLVEWEVSAGKNAKVAVHRQNVFFRFHRQGDTYGNSFLSEAAEPFGDLT